MAIRIPTGPVSKNTARNVSFLLGLASLVVSFFAPQYADHLQKAGALLGGLGLTLGKAEQ
jgi:4-hydroxybenzoate polyprenyltransferase